MDLILIWTKSKKRVKKQSNLTAMPDNTQSIRIEL